MLCLVVPEPRPLHQARGVGDLTLCQTISLLEARGGRAMAAAAVLRLQLPPGMRPQLEDQCTLAMLGLVQTTREHGACVTSKGARWLYPLIGG